MRFYFLIGTLLVGFSMSVQAVTIHCKMNNYNGGEHSINFDTEQQTEVAIDLSDSAEFRCSMLTDGLLGCGTEDSENNETKALFSEDRGDWSPEIQFITSRTEEGGYWFFGCYHSSTDEGDVDLMMQRLSELSRPSTLR